MVNIFQAFLLKSIKISKEYSDNYVCKRWIREKNKNTRGNILQALQGLGPSKL